MRKILYKAYIYSFPFSLILSIKDVLLIAASATLFFEKIKKSKINTQLIIIIFLFLVVNSLLSTFYIFLNFDYPALNVLSRLLKQILRTILCLLEVYLGYEVLNTISPASLKKIILSSAILILLFSIYQIVADIISDIISLPQIGFFSYDSEFGLRTSSLAIEPKYLSGYLAVFIFYLKDLIGVEKKKFNKIALMLLLIVSLAIFYTTGSGNGYLTLFMLALFSSILSGLRFFVLTVGCLIFVITVFLNTYETIIFRLSHRVVLDAIMQGDFNMFLLDDFIYLPILAMMKYSYFLPFGFGLGLLHFYANEFIGKATWITDTKIIDSNFAIFGNVSNYGIILSFAVFYFICHKTYKLLKSSFFTNDIRSTVRLCFYFFIAGFFVNGNISNLFFFSIGVLYFLTTQNKEKLK